MMNIVLKNVGPNKVQVIKALREVTGLELGEVKDIVDGVAAGKEYTIANIQEADINAVEKKFTQIGAIVIVDEDRMDNLTEDENLSESAKICNECESELEDGADNSSEGANKEEKGKKAFNKLIDKCCSFLERVLEWHEKSYRKNKVCTIALIIAEAALVLWLLFKTWEMLVCILIIAVIALPFIMKHDFTDKDRQNSKEIIVGFAKIVVGIIIIVVIALNWNSISSIWSPGAVVRNSYFISYSDEITIGEAFENVFTNCKWSKYSYNGNEYVRFTGNFTTDEGSTSTYQFNFLVLGDSCSIESIYIDGVDVSWMETVVLLGIYNQNGVSW